MTPNSFSPCPSCGGSEADCCEKREERKRRIAELQLEIIEAEGELAMLFAEDEEEDNERAAWLDEKKANDQ